NKYYPDAKADLYACFIQRNIAFAKPNGFIGMITIPNWMFLSTFDELRKSILAHQTLDTVSHNGRGVFGSDFGSSSFVFRYQIIVALFVGSSRSRGAWRVTSSWISVSSQRAIIRHRSRTFDQYPVSLSHTGSVTSCGGASLTACSWVRSQNLVKEWQPVITI